MVRRSLILRSCRLHRRSLRVRCTSSPAQGLRLNARASAVRSSTQREHTCKMWRPTVPGRRAACWVTCSGPRNVRRRGEFVPHRRIRARAASELARRRTTFRSRCLLYVKADRSSLRPSAYLCVLCVEETINEEDAEIRRGPQRNGPISNSLVHKTSQNLTTFHKTQRTFLLLFQ